MDTGFGDIVDYVVRDGVGVITLNAPPVHALARSLRSALLESLDEAAADTAVEVIVLRGSGRMFCGGANLADFETDGLAEPSLHITINDCIESLDKPVIAAMHGMALGGGLELALSCHYRIATADTMLGLPEITLGFIPGAGGTQKLPRAIGLERALDMILSGRSHPANSFADTALIDAIVTGDLLDEAVAFARRVAAIRPLPRLRDRRVDHPHAAAFLQFARRTLAANRRAPYGAQAAIDAVERATSRNFADGMAYEFTRFRELADSRTGRALRYGFLARSAARKLDDVASDMALRPIARAAVIGAGLMGSGIAICLAEADIAVTLIDNSDAGLDRGRAAVVRHVEALVKRGKRNGEQAAALHALISYANTDDALATADLIIEAVFEDFGVKRAVLQRMDAVARPGTILASNTSSLDLNALAALTSRPADVVGLHFFSPAQIMPLLEVVRGKATGGDVLATVLKLATRLRKTPVVAGVCDGFIGNRMIDAYTNQAFAMLIEGALPQQVDAALEAFGMAMGPFRMLDLVGNDVPWAVRKRQYGENPAMPRATAADMLCEQGLYGQKTGNGWYRDVAGEKRPLPNPDVATMLERLSAEQGIVRRPVGAQEIVDRCILALVNEGARLLEEGIAQRASDIDVVYLAGYGFPASRGGPMFHADEVGLHTVIRTMNRFAAQGGPYAAFWQPAPLLLERAAAHLDLKTATGN